MPKQTFEIVRTPEEPPLTAKEITRWLWIHRPKSEWSVKEIVTKVLDEAGRR